MIDRGGCLTVCNVDWPTFTQRTVFIERRAHSSLSCLLDFEIKFLSFYIYNFCFQKSFAWEQKLTCLWCPRHFKVNTTVIQPWFLVSSANKWLSVQGSHEFRVAGMYSTSHINETMLHAFSLNKQENEGNKVLVRQLTYSWIRRTLRKNTI